QRQQTTTGHQRQARRLGDNGDRARTTVQENSVELRVQLFEGIGDPGFEFRVTKLYVCERDIMVEVDQARFRDDQSATADQVVQEGKLRRIGRSALPKDISGEPG